MIKTKSIFIYILAIFIVLGLTVDASAITGEILLNNSVPDALDPIKEQKALEEFMKSNSEMFDEQNNLIKIDPNNQIVLTFDDGSRIEYSFQIHEIITPLNSIASSFRTYTVQKTYFYLIGSVTMRLHAECTHVGRSVTINRLYDSFICSLARVDSNNTAIIRATGFQGTYAIGEGWGVLAFQVTQLDEWLSRSYRMQILVDPAGLAYLNVID